MNEHYRDGVNKILNTLELIATAATTELFAELLLDLKFFLNFPDTPRMPLLLLYVNQLRDELLKAIEICGENNVTICTKGLSSAICDLANFFTS